MPILNDKLMNLLQLGGFLITLWTTFRFYMAGAQTTKVVGTFVTGVILTMFIKNPNTAFNFINSILNFLSSLIA